MRRKFCSGRSWLPSDFFLSISSEALELRAERARVATEFDDVGDDARARSRAPPHGLRTFRRATTVDSTSFAHGVVRIGEPDGGVGEPVAAPSEPGLRGRPTKRHVSVCRVELDTVCDRARYWSGR